MDSKEQFSVTLSNVLDVMGYSYEQIKNGQQMASRFQELLNQEFGEDLTVFIAGSKKEGLSFVEINSDIDLMFIFNKVMCYNGDSSTFRLRASGSTYILDLHDTPPGYAMLVVDEHSNDNNNLLHICSIKPQKKYFSSELISTVMSTLTGTELRFDNTSREVGPSTRKLALSQLTRYTEQLANMEKDRQNKERTVSNGQTLTPEGDTIIYDRKRQPDTDIPPIQRHGSGCARGYHTADAADKQLAKFETQMVYKEHQDARVIQSTSQSKLVTYGRESDKSQPETLIKAINRTGPSQATQYKQPLGTFISQDNVIAFPAQIGIYMHQWSSRKRHHGFPTEAQILKISKMDAHVVPVGCKKTDCPDLQWRICFTFGEVELVHSLNATQYKLYVILRHLSKTVIKSDCPNVITSYVMKNVVLWMAEMKPQSYFTEDNLENCLVESVHFLKVCVSNGYIPNYMIQLRNLLQDKLSIHGTKTLLNLLKTMVSERGSMVMRCETIRNNLMSPYMKYFFAGSGASPRLYNEVFEMFYDPDIQQPLNDMESVFALLISAIESSFNDKSMTVKFQCMIVLKYIENWITELPNRAQDKVPGRANLRKKCVDSKRKIAVSFARDFSNDSSYIELLKIIASAQVQNVTTDAVAAFVRSDDFVNDLADVFLKTADYLGVIDDRKMASLLTDPMQMLQTLTGASRVCQNQTRSTYEYSDIDLD